MMSYTTRETYSVKPCFIDEMRLKSLPLCELKGFREKVKSLIDSGQYYINDKGEVVVYEYAPYYTVPYYRTDCVIPNVLTMDLV